MGVGTKDIKLTKIFSKTPTLVPAAVKKALRKMAYSITDLIF